MRLACVSFKFVSITYLEKFNILLTYYKKMFFWYDLFGQNWYWLLVLLSTAFEVNKWSQTIYLIICSKIVRTILDIFCPWIRNVECPPLLILHRKACYISNTHVFNHFNIAEIRKCLTINDMSQLNWLYFFLVYEIIVHLTIYGILDLIK